MLRRGWDLLKRRPTWAAFGLAIILAGMNLMLLVGTLQKERLARRLEEQAEEFKVNLELLKKTEIVITTLGEMGSRLITSGGEIAIPAAKPKVVTDPTGAGDAYRAGLIKGLVQSKGLKQCAIMGSVCASFAVECYGTQEYHFSLDEFKERLNTYSNPS